MLQIDKTLISDNLIDIQFACDLKACKGACCIEGDSGAPLEENERKLLDELYPIIKPYLRPEAAKIIEEKGKYYVDDEHEHVTMLVNGNECAYTIFDDDGIAFCGIEKAFLDGKITFRKPISCYLYPVRVKEFTELTAVNYDEWDICKSALTCGKKTKMPVYKFLKEPLSQKFGDDWYKQLEIYAKEYKKQGK